MHDERMVRVGTDLRSLRLDCGVKSTHAKPAEPAPKTANIIVPGHTNDIPSEASDDSVSAEPEPQPVPRTSRQPAEAPIQLAGGAHTIDWGCPYQTLGTPSLCYGRHQSIVWEPPVFVMGAPIQMSGSWHTGRRRRRRQKRADAVGNTREDSARHVVRYVCAPVPPPAPLPLRYGRRWHCCGAVGSALQARVLAVFVPGGWLGSGAESSLVLPSHSCA